jgi:hypothetical protein
MRQRESLDFDHDTYSRIGSLWLQARPRVVGLTLSRATFVHQLLDAAMKTSRNLGLAAVVVFVISHFLPAYGDSSGFACFGICWNMLLGHDTEILSGGWFYYSGFAISNIIFLVLVVALFVTKKSRKLRSVVSVVFLLHVLSWAVLHIFPTDLTEIKIGYYVWLVAYGLLVAAHLCKEPRQQLESIPHAGSVV